MRFKHTIHVLIDNFRITYKMLLYILIVTLISGGLCAAIIIPFLRGLDSNGNLYNQLLNSISDLLNNIGNGNIEAIQDSVTAVRNSFSSITDYLVDNPSSFVLCIVGLAAVSLVSHFFIGLGNYAAATNINDRMTMQTGSSFMGSLIKNLGRASAMSGIYAPLSLIYDVLTFTLSGYLMLGLLYKKAGAPILIALMLFVVLVLLFMAVKMTFTTDWLPAMICGKQHTISAMHYSFSRRGKHSGEVYSFYATSLVMIMALNVLAAIGTLGAALLITVPLSYLYVLCYEFVNYRDAKELKYFIDKRTIIKPEHEKARTREQFLRGDD